MKKHISIQDKHWIDGFFSGVASERQMLTELRQSLLTHKTSAEELLKEEKLPEKQKGVATGWLHATQVFLKHMREDQTL